MISSTLHAGSFQPAAVCQGASLRTALRGEIFVVCDGILNNETELYTDGEEWGISTPASSMQGCS